MDARDSTESPAMTDANPDPQASRPRPAATAGPTIAVAAQAAHRRQEPLATSATSSCRACNAYYGSNHAVRGVDLALRRRQGDRDHRPLGLRQVDDGALHQPHARGDRRRPRRGRGPARRARPLRLADRHRRRPPRRSAWSSRNRTRSRRCRSSTTSPPACGLDRRLARARWTTAAAKRSSRRRPLGRGQGPAQGPRGRPLRRPAAAPLHRPRARGRAGGAADGRALLGPRPGGDAEDRGADRRAEAAGARSSIVTHNMQQAARVADTTVLHARGRRAGRGRAPTDKIFTNPDDERTEQYVTGKFG